MSDQQVPFSSSGQNSYLLGLPHSRPSPSAQNLDLLGLQLDELHSQTQWQQVDPFGLDLNLDSSNQVCCCGLLHHCCNCQCFNNLDSMLVNISDIYILTEPHVKDSASDVQQASRPAKPHHCAFCQVFPPKAFRSANDLKRHLRTVHDLVNHRDTVWQCRIPDCKAVGKKWPRFDNFKAHVKRMHGELADEILRIWVIDIAADMAIEDSSVPVTVSDDGGWVILPWSMSQWQTGLLIGRDGRC